MLVRLTDKTLQRIDDDHEYDGGYAENIANLFRIRMQQIRAVDNENELRRLKSLHFEKLKGKRKHEYSMRLNKQFRLIFQIEKVREQNQLVVTGIEDYHS
jgi:proteic killer suppression protein